MRFLAGGPSIPNELLIARDEGRVIFFCGAGVSYACAGLPDFLKLAQEVTAILGVTADDPVRKILEEAREIGCRTGFSGLIPADRIFGLLEHSFSVRDIEASVAKILKPKSTVDLSAHKIMLDLARGPDGNTRLVTTNFDLLFESCDPSLSQNRTPRLPDLHRYEEFKGVIHLHGHVDKDYTKAVGDGFVLSSSGFGRAYLSDGWATSFIKSVLEKYIVVFVGYTADDPPVQYLLEALNSDPTSLGMAYAFQSGGADEAEAKWRPKGVQAIAYNEAERHKALWETLEAWAHRAINPDEWYDEVIAMARKGPEALMPHERGQVAHIVFSPEGARRFSASDDPPPAEWLCVFDPSIRYSKPGRIGNFYEQGSSFDPFDAYGIDSDPSPPKIEPNNYTARRETPAGVWNGFLHTRLDLQNLQEPNFAALRGHLSINVPALPIRLWHLGFWISKVSNQPAAVWWASAQVGIHPSIQNQICHALERKKKNCSPEVRQAWRYIFKAWEEKRNDAHHDWYQLKGLIDLDGWTNGAIKEFAFIHRPYLKVEKPYLYGPKPPENKEKIRVAEMVHLDVEYPWAVSDVQIPDEFLLTTIREFQRNLEYGVFLENEIGGYGFHNLCPIEADPDIEGYSSERTHGISRLFLFFVNLLKRLTQKEPQTAKQECLSWSIDEDVVFTRLRIYLSGFQHIFSGKEAGRIICNLSDQAFWDARHQRDLLLVLKRRWNDSQTTVRKRIERRLLRGRSRWEGEEKAEFIERRARRSLERIHWLKDQGCRFTFNVDVETAKLKKFAPQWQLTYAKRAAASREGRGGPIRTETQYSVLLNEPPETLLEKAKELTGTMHEGFVERDPFAGLASERPDLAIAALDNYAQRNDYPKWAWQKFLYSEVQKADSPDLTFAIVKLILDMPPIALTELVHPISEWLFKSSKLLFKKYREQFEQIWIKLIKVLKIDPGIAKSSIIRGSREPDWAEEALNAPVGNLSRVLMNDPAIENLKSGNTLPASWIGRVEDLLQLEGDLRCHVVVMLAYHLNLFYDIDPNWTEKNLITVLNQKGDDKNAFWAGFFWHAKTPNAGLYRKLKPYLLMLEPALSESQKSGLKTQVLSGILLVGWISIDEKTGERFVTSDEMRKTLVDADEEFRLQVLWHLERRISNDKRRGEKRKLREILHNFLTEVWPLQKKVKSPKISGNLLDLAFSIPADFSKTVDLILPFITEISRDYISIYTLGKEKSYIIDKFPEKTLELIYAVLSENISEWPYGVEVVLERIGVADPALLKDSRLVELKRRWNAR